MYTEKSIVPVDVVISTSFRIYILVISVFSGAFNIGLSNPPNLVESIGILSFLNTT